LAFKKTTPMKLKVTTQQTTELEIETPAFFKRGIFIYAITEEAIMTVGPSTVWTNKIDKDNHNDEVFRASSGTKTTLEDFEAAYHKAQKSIAEQFNTLHELEGTGALAE
jgi:hypothetical protein